MPTPLIDATGVPILEVTIDPGTPGVVINTSQILQLPINCVVAGQQPEPASGLMGLNGAIRSPLRGIFRE